MREVLILGSGGTTTDVAETLATPAYSNYRLLGCLDDDPSKQGNEVGGVPVLGGLALAHDYPQAQLVLALGSPRSFGLRLPLLKQLGLTGRSFLTVVHPTAWVSPTASLGQGCIVFAFTQISNHAVLEDHVILLSHCAINHDAVMGSGSICASSVTVSGGTRIGRGCYLGAGSVLRDGVIVSDGVLVGAGAVVVSDLPGPGVFAGNPARALERR